jgi:phosphoserine phosphatase RsbU/P
MECASAASGEWNRDRLAQVVENLLVNALRYGEPIIPTTIRTGGDRETPLLEVHNCGAPIAAEGRAHLVRPMQRGVSGADKATRSVGLGLYIVHQIVQGHGGAIDVYSGADGTTFTIRLPRNAPAAP